MRTKADRDRAWEIIGRWSEPLQAIAATYPVRIALDAEGWAYVRERALGDGLAAAAFKGLGREMAKPVEPDELPAFFAADEDGAVYLPGPPFGRIPHFKTETVNDPKGGGAQFEICADGQRIGVGVW